MKSPKKHTGFAIAIAWPQTYCKQPGAWYDPITTMLGVNKNNYYKVGHAALILVDKTNTKAHYFDFGRYHAPYKHGRVRSADTDQDLKINTSPQSSEDGKKLENFKDLLNELQSNSACHGEGELHASYCQIDFEKAFAKASKMQEAGAIPYGPFHYNGSNCSRFVNISIVAGKPDFKTYFNLYFKVPLTPTPLNNVNSLKNRLVIPKLLKGDAFCPNKKLDKQTLLSTLPQPIRHTNVPEEAQWLSGEGAGSWFAFAIKDSLLKVTRYSPQGIVECSGLYENKDALDLLRNNSNYSLRYPSNCKVVSLKVKGMDVQFQRASEVAACV